ncbi:penicillin-binding protein 2 [bacterium SCN 62-11]|nr:MAG: penicillin-binding protein 2 [bacterium SCN 62-11]
MLGLGTLACLVCLGCRFYQLQVVEFPVHQRKALRDSRVLEHTTPPRGRLYDMRGRLLVSDEPHYQLWVRPGELQKRGELEGVLSEALGQPRSELRARITRALALAPLEPLVLQRTLSEQQLARSAVRLRGLPGVYLEAAARRRYFHRKTAADVLGYTGEISEEELKRLAAKGGYSARDMLGKTGLEKEYDVRLRGRKGLQAYTVDARGRTLSVEDARSPVAGADLYLTLDLGLQQRAEQLLEAAVHSPHGGAVVVLDPQSGRVRALASRPNFDPRPFARGITNREYQALLKDPSAPLLSRAFEGAYSPGSTFKLVTSSAGLAEKLCTPNSMFYCSGSYHGQNCFVTSGHGSISFVESLAQSCDVVYYRMADRLGPNRLARYCRAFGLGSATGIDLPHEDPGLVPDPKWKEKVWKEPWGGYDTTNMGIGQGMLLVTPLQMAVTTAAVANGGKVYAPFLVEKIVSRAGALQWSAHPRPRRKVPVPARALAAVRQGMVGAVDHGTGGAAAIPGVQVAGKTGTVETNGPNHTWFVSFAPAAKPRLVIVVFLEKSGGFGGEKAAGIAGELYRYAFRRTKK